MDYSEDSLRDMTVEQLQHIISRHRCLPPEDNEDQDALVRAILNPIKLISKLSVNELSAPSVVINIKITDTRVQLPEILNILRQSAPPNDRQSNIKLCINEIYQPIAAPPNPSIYVPSHSPVIDANRLVTARPPRVSQPLDLSAMQTNHITTMNNHPFHPHYPPPIYPKPEPTNLSHSPPSSPEPGPRSPKQKRTRLSIDEKIEVVKRAKLGLEPERHIPKRTMRNLLQRADEIEAAANMLTEEERKQRKNFHQRKSATPTNNSSSQSS